MKTTTTKTITSEHGKIEAQLEIIDQLKALIREDTVNVRDLLIDWKKTLKSQLNDLEQAESGREG